MTSMMVWMIAVERGSHCVNMSERRLLRSLEFNSRGEILRFRVEIILLIFSAFLRPPTIGQFHPLVHRSIKKTPTGSAGRRRTPPRCFRAQIVQTKASMNGRGGACD